MRPTKNIHKWLFIRVYKPASHSDKEFTTRSNLIIDHYLPKYESLIFNEDFNLSTKTWYLDEVIQAYNLKTL